MRMSRLLAASLLSLTVAGAVVLSRPAAGQASPLLGRWDITVQGPGGTFPSWLEVKLSGSKTLVGSYVGHFGSARPVAQVFVDGNHFRFSVPVQWESGKRDLSFEGTVEGDRLTGREIDDTGKEMSWTAVRAPYLDRAQPPKWGKSIDLWNGTDQAGWHPRDAKRPNGWAVEDGMLRNVKPGNDLVTDSKWTDFKLHAEFRYPAKSNSGIYLRGRYEAQIEDNYGLRPESHLIGGIYGFLTPRVNAAKPAGEWQTYDVALVGRYVTISLNGEKVVESQEIPGITGGALDANEGEPGPIVLQGDHGKIDFRKVTLTPSR